jgi:enoyl-CoA hydratase/carnithine racemase
MSATGPARLERRDDGVALLTLDRPPVNALGRELVTALATALEQLRGDPSTRCRG